MPLPSTHLVWRRPASVIGALALLCGCASWQRLAAPADTTFAPRQQVQVWQGSQAQVLHAVRLTPDSLFGVPFHQTPSCDGCRVVVPRAHIDSLRLGDQETPALFVAALPFAVLVYLLITLRGPLFS